MNSRIESIIENDACRPFYDPELWDFVTTVHGNNLANAPTDALQKRLVTIEKNIQFLRDSQLVRTDIRENDGWRSLWWWFRSRHWTVAELKNRKIQPHETPLIEPPPKLHEDVARATIEGDGILARVGRQDHALQFFSGKLRFTPAASYDDDDLDEARADNEMRKAYKRPGQAITITTTDGRPIKPVGDVEFASERGVEVAGTFVPRPYLMCSFSNEIDPRLMTEFPGSDTFLVVYDVEGFLRRSVDHLDKVVPGPRKGVVTNEYYDPYFRSAERPSAMKSKRMGYAYQREVRFVIDPGERTEVASEIFESQTGAFDDVAAVYDAQGAKIAGTGPSRLFADGSPIAV